MALLAAAVWCFAAAIRIGDWPCRGVLSAMRPSFFVDLLCMLCSLSVPYASCFKGCQGHTCNFCSPDVE